MVPRIVRFCTNSPVKFGFQEIFRNNFTEDGQNPPKLLKIPVTSKKKSGPRYFGLEPLLKFLIDLIEPYIISKLMQSHEIKRVKVIKRENIPILGPNRKIYRLL